MDKHTQFRIMPITGTEYAVIILGMLQLPNKLFAWRIEDVIEHGNDELLGLL